MSWQRELLLEAASFFTADVTTSALGPDVLLAYLEKRGVPAGYVPLFEKVSTRPELVTCCTFVNRAVQHACN